VTDDKVVLLEVATGARLDSFPGGDGATFSPDDCLLAIWSRRKQSVLLWDIQTGSPVQEHERADVEDVAVLADGTVLSFIRPTQHVSWASYLRFQLNQLQIMKGNLPNDNLPRGNPPKSTIFLQDTPSRSVTIS
jgi:WD40 repeat protein